MALALALALAWGVSVLSQTEADAAAQTTLYVLVSDARGLIRALTLALSIPVSMLAAVLCASLGRRLGRLPAFVLWAALGAGALFGLSVAVASSPWWQLQPLGPAVVFLGWVLSFWRVRES